MKLRTVIALAAMMAAIRPASAAQSQSASAPHFEVASLKPNNGCQNTPRAGNLSPSPGRLEMPCVTLQNLIQSAYGTFGDGATVNPQPLHTEGGAPWMQSEYFALSAKSEGPARTEMLAGPMLQTLLAERFHLQIHRETREMPVYAMTVLKGGLKVQRLAEGACVAIDLSHPPPPRAPGDPPPNLCGLLMLGSTPSGSAFFDLRGATMTQLAQRLSGRVDRPVVDKTGIEGKFNFRVEYAADPAMRAPGIAPGRAGDAGIPPDAGTAASDPTPTLFEALQDAIGLKLSPEKGPVQFLIIDHAERLSAN